MIWLQGLFQHMLAIQREIYAAFAGRIGTFAETGDWAPLAVFLPVGILFGAVHALTPGHSKLVLATYVAGSPAKARQALAMSILLSIVHVSTAVVIALFSLPLITFALTGAGQAPLVEDVSRGLLGLIGLWMLWQALRHQDEQPDTHHRNAAFALLAGLVPCPLTLFVMIFAMTRQVPEAGLAFAVVMMAGVAITLSAVALAAVVLRQTLMGFVASNPRSVELTRKGLQSLTGLILIAIAVSVLSS